MLKWAIELSEYEIKYQLRLSLKGQIMANFIVELPKKQTLSTYRPGEQWWILHVDRASRVSGSKRVCRLDLSLMLAVTKLEIRSNSQLIFRQIQREYEVNDERIMRYLALVE
ncbi:hypothetical protein AAG906_038110 [Vitis piasezkii]